ncbi:MAG: hypothetical protein DMG86_14085 [Acidobacteria bacterium]|nr:MAG: hypothetical protein DMG86_14085 [Acidobacteriota bacterium]
MSKLASIHSGEDLLHKPGFRFISLFNVPRIISLLVLVSALTAQVAEHQTRVGFPQDWTHRHVVFHRQTLWQHPQLTSEPRVLHQFIRKMAYSAVGPFAASDEVSPKRTAALRRDWSVNLGVGKVAFGMSPVKYGFDVNALPSCANDFALVSRAGRFLWHRCGDNLLFVQHHYACRRQHRYLSGVITRREKDCLR